MQIYIYIHSCSSPAKEKLGGVLMRKAWQKEVKDEILDFTFEKINNISQH